MRPHVWQTRIYYADTDAGGVVYHGKYLELAERARTEALRDAGIPHAAMLADHDRSFMVRRVNLEYLRPARLDDLLTITTEPGSETAATLSLRQVFSHAGGAVLAVLDLELVCVSAVTGRPCRVPAAWRGLRE